MKPHRLDRTLGWRAGLAAGLALGGLLAAPSTSDAIATRTAIAQGAPDGATARYIVRSNDDQLLAVGRAAVALGGRLVASQTTLGTVVVDLPVGTANRLRAVAGVEQVMPDSKLQLQSLGETLLGQEPTAVGPPSNLAALTGATTFWRNGYSGQGVDVALLDSGVLPVEGMMTANKLVIGPDLSFESQAPNLEHLDTFGHGTHMAGIIAGRDSGLRVGKEHDVRQFAGVAPGARVVDVKVGAGDGGVDVSQVVAAIDWVVANRERHGVRVINLSYGTASSQPYQLDPLAHAVESAWHAGVVVVVAAGNDGESGALPLTMPAADPFVIAVGSSDHRGSADVARWRVGAWTNAGTEARRPDVLAPGKSVVSLRVPGSLADVEHPERPKVEAFVIEELGRDGARLWRALLGLLPPQDWEVAYLHEDVIYRTVDDLPIEWRVG